MAENVEISIPLSTEQMTELQAMCAAMGMAVETFISDSLEQAISAHRQRYNALQARIEAQRKRATDSGIRIVDATTREPVIVAEPQPELEVPPVFEGMRDVEQ